MKVVHSLTRCCTHDCIISDCELDYFSRGKEGLRASVCSLESTLAWTEETMVMLSIDVHEGTMALLRPLGYVTTKQTGTMMINVGGGFSVNQFVQPQELPRYSL